MSLVNTTTVAEILGRDYGTFSRTFGGIAVLLLLVLLAQRELLRAGDSPHSRVGERAITATLVPLLLACALIIAARFIDLLVP